MYSCGRTDRRLRAWCKVRLFFRRVRVSDRNGCGCRRSSAGILPAVPRASRSRRGGRGRPPDSRRDGGATLCGTKITMAIFNCSAILFDLDGVLVDSTGSVDRQWRAWARAKGVDGDKIIAIAHGLRSLEVIRRVAPHLDAEAEVE